MFCLGSVIHMILYHLADVITHIFTKFYTKNYCGTRSLSFFIKIVFVNMVTTFIKLI